MRASILFQKVGMLSLSVMFALSTLSFAPAQTESHRAALIFLKHVEPFCSSEVACLPQYPPEVLAAVLPPRHSAIAYQNLVNARVSPYMVAASFHKHNITFEAIVNPNSADGWFEAPHTLEEYNAGVIDLHLEGIQMAYAAIGSALADYDFVITVRNLRLTTGYALLCPTEDGGLVTCGHPLPGGGVITNAIVAAENESDEKFVAVVAHEIGHHYGMWDQGVPGVDNLGMGPWDVMGACPYLNHYGGWSKWKAGWVQQVTDMPLAQNATSITVQLDPLEYAGNNLLRIPFAAGEPFIGYMVECRAQVNRDEKIPEAGVLITDIDPSRAPGVGVPAHVVFPLGDVNYDTAALAPGEAYVDETRDITITYLSKTATNDCQVKAERGAITAPDLLIKGPEGEPTAAGYLRYKSGDIWIDSPKNGWDVYPNYEDYSMEGGHVTPAGYGDPFWVGHENRIKFLVRNVGFGPAQDVKVNVFVTQPLYINIPGITCGPREKAAELIASLVIDEIGAGEVKAFDVPWTPKVNKTAQVEVIIEDYVGELTHANNSAGETYQPQYTFTELAQDLDLKQDMSSLAGQESSQIYTIESEENCLAGRPFYLHPIYINAIERRHWVMQITPDHGISQPGEETQVEIRSMAPPDAKAGDCADLGFVVSAIIGYANVPVQRVDFRACVVAPSALTCQVPADPVDQSTSITVSGQLTPAAKDEIVALEFTNPQGERALKTAKLDARGAYQLKFTPDLAGDWQMQAFWQGSQASAPTESEMCTFTVESDTPQFTLNHNINCRSGPSTLYEVITSGRIGDVMEIEARSPDSLWLYGKMKYSKCWVSLELGKLNIKPWELPVRQPPKAPEPNTDPCAQYNTMALCRRHLDQCVWKVDPAGAGKCESK